MVRAGHSADATNPSSRSASTVGRASIPRRTRGSSNAATATAWMRNRRQVDMEGDDHHEGNDHDDTDKENDDDDDDAAAADADDDLHRLRARCVDGNAPHPSRMMHA